jgi:hypothetical protein
MENGHSAEQSGLDAAKCAPGLVLFQAFLAQSLCQHPFGKRSGDDAYGIADEITPYKAVAQENDADAITADRIDPGSMVELADFTTVGNGQGQRRRFPYCPTGIDKPNDHEDHPRPECIAAILGDECRNPR